MDEFVALANHTTFHIGGPARFFCVVKNRKDIIDALRFAKENQLRIFVLGGGSNVLVSDEGFNGLVIQPQIEGMEIISEDNKSVHIKIGAGEMWDAAAAFTVERSWWGIENLSHIPGNAGAFAVQNVGAYGQEASQVVEEVEAFNIKSGEVEFLKGVDCNFTYRHSVFNTTKKDTYIILSTTVRLSKISNPNLSYGDVKKYFANLAIENPSQQQIRQAITKIRNTKFPYPSGAINGNAGSFFRGPVISDRQLQGIQSVLSAQFGHAASDRLEAMKDQLKVPQGYKTPVAFLMELAGLKGFQIGGAKINDTQPAIVLNATGSATAEDVLKLTDYVLKKIKQLFEIELEVEPAFVGFDEGK